MHALIIYAHPEPKSFNGALKDRAVTVLNDMGWTVEVSDLFAMEFDPLPRKSDFKVLFDPDFFKYQAEQAHAAKSGGFSADIEAEIAKLERADFLLLQFPLWWFSMPAIMKGWVDRVFAMGVIYGGGVGWYDKGRFKGNKAMVSLSTGGPESFYGATGINGLIDTVLWPIQNGILNFTGYSVLPPYVAPGPARASDGERARMLDGLEKRLRSIESTEPLFFHPLADFDIEKGGALRPGVQGATVGQPGNG